MNELALHYSGITNIVHPTSSFTENSTALRGSPPVPRRRRRPHYLTNDTKKALFNGLTRTNKDEQ
jgi:hypothetical protein